MKMRWQLVLAVALAVAGLSSSLPAPASANGPILRIAADFFNFDGTETFTHPARTPSTSPSPRPAIPTTAPRCG